MRPPIEICPIFQLVDDHPLGPVTLCTWNKEVCIEYFGHRTPRLYQLSVPIAIDRENQPSSVSDTKQYIYLNRDKSSAPLTTGFIRFTVVFFSGLEFLGKSVIGRGLHRLRQGPIEDWLTCHRILPATIELTGAIGTIDSPAAIDNLTELAQQISACQVIQPVPLVCVFVHWTESGVEARHVGFQVRYQRLWENIRLSIRVVDTVCAHHIWTKI